MNHLKLDEILHATGGKALCAGTTAFTGVSIDSRTIKEGELFVALKGPKFDGHDFLGDALKLGGGALISDTPAKLDAGKTVILAADTLTALQDIARRICARKAVPVVGVTGTNGKTTTKEMLVSILGQSRSVLKTKGNLNNYIGLPLCVANMHGDEKVMVLEMGSNVEGDIALLCEIARPGFAVVTNVGQAHLEGFGSIETVRKTDLEILKYAEVASFNADDDFLMQGTEGYKGKTITYAIGKEADLRAEDISLGEKGSTFTLRLPKGVSLAVKLGVPGHFNVYNALAAASIAGELGAKPEEIRLGLESFGGVPMRIEIKEVSGILVISDLYNANPASMKAAVKELLRLKRQRAIAVLGDMLELGHYSGGAHRDLVRSLSASGVDILIAVGAEMSAACAEFTGSCHTAEDSEQARSLLAGIAREGDTVLVKGSRGMRMERAVPTWSATGRRNAV